METGLCILLTFLLQQFTESSSTNQTVHPPGQSRCRLVVSSATEFGVKRVGFANPHLSAHFQESLTFYGQRQREDRKTGWRGGTGAHHGSGSCFQPHLHSAQPPT
ncbi:hypothetical protein AMECASPLE_003493 [Ameca splendens]|uniref:Uncharacterized protein n=1 Tax=Ameca splendens TaxID=208324 RepID=A0ABV0ZJ96_9TELE